MRSLPLFGLIMMLGLNSCHFLHQEKVKGNGVVKTETRSVSDFDRVSVSGNIDIYVSNDSSNSVRVEADENLMDFIEVGVNGGKLQIRPQEGYNLKGSRDIRVYVSAPVFKEFRASGSCNIYSQNKISSPGTIDISLSGASDVKMELNAPGVNANLSGAGSIQLKGQTKDLSVDGAGSVSVECMDLMAENVDVEISGAGNAAVFASVKLDVSVSGAGDVVYKGNAVVNQHISGSGSVKKAE
jgi:hypothetical protein